jgi:signal transduction histidine kinase
LGLWVVRTFVEMFGGEINVKSPIPELDYGTIFTLAFPLVQDDKVHPINFLLFNAKQKMEVF